MWPGSVLGGIETGCPNMRAATNTCGCVQEYAVLVIRFSGTLQATRDISFFFRAHSLLQKKR